MDLGIAGKRAIVCASTRGLGRGCAEALAAEGCHLVINGRDRDLLYELAANLARQHKVEVTPILGDVSDPEVQKKLVGAWAEVDILVNNNGGPPRRDYVELDRKAILDGVTQNMVTPIELIRAVIDGMRARKFGRIVNITSSSVLAPISGLDLSSGARAGLSAFLAGVSRQVAGDGITINNLLPGKFETERLMGGHKRNAEKSGKPLDAVIAQEKAAIPARRFGTSQEFGEVCAFLCSVQAGYITGQNILLDGGLLPRAF
ncbi:MAG: SDR family oxidoreductase [Rhizobiales bacterium]|nr:SDR family oxidoreductase [Hyphomicrobiales bacterium]MBN9009044.1 SDR family oxidoreductase [Hyphomicrobiales bacterium]